MNHVQHNQIVNFIWSIADDVLRDVYPRGKYRDIILPFTVLRRLDAILEPTKEKVLEMHEKLNQMKIDNQAPQLRKVSGYVFYNTSPFTFKKLLNDPPNIRQNLENYLDGFSSSVQDIISKFQLRNQLTRMEEGNITFPLVEKFCTSQINLSPKAVTDKEDKIIHEGLSNLAMGYVFEELIRKFNEENNEEAGEHFTPREIIKLMTHLIFDPIKNKIKDGTYLIYDPACGSGGMLTEAENFAKQINPKASFHLYGQEVNPETYAICKADMLIKEEDPDKIAYGSTLGNDGFPNLQFDFMLSNPPYGKTWKIDEDAIVSERGKKGKEHIKDHRFNIGLPVISDGQLLFLMNMVSKMKAKTELGSRIASVHNGSALFSGEAGTGESEIRRHLLENDLLECVIALPTDIFYNTGLPTYIIVLTNKKSDKRKGKVQLINTNFAEFYTVLNKSFGSKKHVMHKGHIEKISSLFIDMEESIFSKIFSNEEFAYYKVPIESPLLNDDNEIVFEKGKMKADKELKDYEKVPYGVDIEKFFSENVAPYKSNAWIDFEHIKLGYEIQFSKAMFLYKSKASYEELKKELTILDTEISELINAQTNFDHLINSYETLKPSETDWVDEIPAHWVVVKNRELFDERIERGGTAEELLSVTQDRGIIRQSDDGKKDSSNEDKSKYKRVEIGDLVYNKMRMWQGAVGYSSYNGIVSPAYVVLKPRTKIYTKFFYYLFKTPHYIEQSKKFSYGLCDDMNSLRFEDFRNMTSICPEYEEQQEIADTLEDRFKKLDDLFIKKAKLIETLRFAFLGKIDVTNKIESTT